MLLTVSILQKKIGQNVFLFIESLLKNILSFFVNFIFWEALKVTVFQVKNKIK